VASVCRVGRDGKINGHAEFSGVRPIIQTDRYRQLDPSNLVRIVTILPLPMAANWPAKRFQT